MFQGIGDIARDYRRQLMDEIIPFWEDRVLDKKHGGYFNYFTREGNLYDTLKPGWFIGRTMHTFALFYNEIEKRDKWLDIASAGRKMMDGSFYAGHGRFNKMLDQKGKVLEGTTSIFTDCFAIKGLYEYIVACGNSQQADLQLAEKLSHHLFENMKSANVQRTECPPGLQKHAMTFMSLVVAQESRRVLEDKYQYVIDECIQRSLYAFASDEHHAAFEYIGIDGKPVLEGAGRILDPGHTMEALWFAMEEGIHSGNNEIIKRAGQILDWVIDRSYDETYGGFYHLSDIDGKTEKLEAVDYGPVKADWNCKIWWVQCEALLALAMSAVLNNNERHWQYFLKQREFTESAFRDKEYGEWYSFTQPDGKLMCNLKGFAGKGPYHVPRCILRLALFLEKYNQTEGSILV